MKKYIFLMFEIKSEPVSFLVYLKPKDHRATQIVFLTEDKKRHNLFKSFNFEKFSLR